MKRCAICKKLMIKPMISMDLAGDIKSLVILNPDVKINENLKSRLNTYDDYDLVKITKEFGSFKITNLELVTEELIKKDFDEFKKKEAGK